MDVESQYTVGKHKEIITKMQCNSNQRLEGEYFNLCKQEPKGIDRPFNSNSKPSKME